LIELRKLRKPKVLYFVSKETGTFEFFEEEEEDPENRAPKKTFIERLNDVQEISLKVQETLDKVASLGERIVK
jgi:hypothetical protein